MVLVYLKNFFIQSSTSGSRTECNEFSPLRDNEFRYGHSYASSQTTQSKLSSADSSTSLPPDTVKDEDSRMHGAETKAYFTRIDPRVISDATIGLSDGLTVPFALTAGLSALGNTRVVILGGLAELIAGAISMGLGGWLAARSEADAYRTLLRSTGDLVKTDRDQAVNLLRESLSPLSQFLRVECLTAEGFAQMTNVNRERSLPMAAGTLNPNAQYFETVPRSLGTDEEICATENSHLTYLLMRYHHCSPSAPSDGRALVSGITIAAAYFCGGFVPLVPYFFASEIGAAFWWSVVVMAVALGLFGAIKTWLISGNDDDLLNIDMNSSVDESSKTFLKVQKPRRWRLLLDMGMGGVQMIFLGGIAAAAAMGLVIVFNKGLP